MAELSALQDAEGAACTRMCRNLGDCLTTREPRFQQLNLASPIDGFDICRRRVAERRTDGPECRSADG